MNQGPWQSLEEKVRGLVDKYGHVWVMTGPLYEKQMLPLPNANEPHKVPSGFWKIIVVRDREEIRVAGFIMEQDTSRSSDIMNHLVTVDEVERRCKLDFLWELPDVEEAILESKIFEAWVREWAD